MISQTGFAFHRILAALSVIVLKFDSLRYMVLLLLKIVYAKYYVFVTDKTLGAVTLVSLAGLAVDQ